MTAKKFLPLILGLLVGLSITDSFAATDNEYIYILGARGNPYWATLADGIKQAANDRDVNAVVYETDNDTDAEAQINLCETAIQRKPKLIAMEAMNSAIGLACFKQATAAGIIVADIDKHLTLDEAAKAGITLAYTVGSDNVLIGQMAAKYAATILDKPNPKILIIEGAAGSIPSQNRVDGFRDAIKNALPAASITSISANWDRLKAMTITSDTLQREPDTDLVYSANDVMALGVAEAVRNSPQAATVKTIGIDGTADARKAITEGRMTATVAQLPYLIGMKAVELSQAAVAGTPYNRTETTPTPVITAESLKAGTDPLLQYVH